MLEYHRDAFYFEASKRKVKYREFSNINNDSSLAEGLSQSVLNSFQQLDLIAS